MLIQQEEYNTGKQSYLRRVMELKEKERRPKPVPEIASDCFESPRPLSIQQCDLSGKGLVVHRREGKKASEGAFVNSNDVSQETN